MRGFKYTEQLFFSAINKTTIEVTFDNGDVKQYTVDAMTPGEDNEVTFTEGEQEFTVTVTDYAALVASTIEITTNRLQVAPSQSLAYTVLDQYGEEMTVAGSALTVTAYNNTTKTNVTTTVTNIGNIDMSGQTANDVIKFTVYLTANPDVKAIKDITLTTIALASITLNDPTVPANAERITVGQTGVVMGYTAKDDNGDAYTLTASSANKAAIETNDGVEIDLTNITGISTDASGKLLLNLSSSTAGDAKIKITIPSTGQIVIKTFKVNAAAGVVATMTLAEEAKTIAAGTTAYVDMTVEDNYGKVLKPADYAGGTYNIISSNPSVVANAGTLLINPTPGNANFGKLEILVAPGATKDAKTTITITSSTGTVYDTITVTAGAAPVATKVAIAANSKHNTNLIVGSDTTIGFTVTDQYGNAIASDGPYQVNYTVLNSATAITKTGNSTNESAATVTVTATEAGTATLKVELVKTSDSTVKDYFSIPFTVVANTSEGLTYAVADIATLYKAGADADADDGDINATEVAAGYVKEISITATDANGNNYTIPSSEIVSVTSDSTAVDIAKVAGKWYVGGTDAAITEDTTVTLNVIFNADDGVSTITKNVLVSKEDLKAQSLAFKDAAYGTAGANDVTAITIPNAAGYAADIAANVGTGKVYLWIKDQFGGYLLGDTAANFNLGFASINGVTDAADDDSVALAAPQVGSLTITDTSSDVTFTKENASFRIVAYTANGKTAYITVTVADGIAPTLDSVTLADVAGGAGAEVDDTITFVFSEAIDPATTAVAGLTAGGAAVGNLDILDFANELAIGDFATPFAIAGGSGSEAMTGSAQLSADGKTLTVTITAITL
ncbi:MAG: hypothetical protein GX295_11555, partial [Syntrophomonadaceae bacterium]|nr:hypothetical protein [Syntrophomonadaceae bacterium]